MDDENLSEKRFALIEPQTETAFFSFSIKRRKLNTFFNSASQEITCSCHNFVSLIKIARTVQSENDS